MEARKWKKKERSRLNDSHIIWSRKKIREVPQFWICIHWSNCVLSLWNCLISKIKWKRNIYEKENYFVFLLEHWEDYISKNLTL